MTKWSFSEKRKAFVRFLRKAGIPAGRSERLAMRFEKLAQPESGGELVATEKGGKMYSVATPSAGLGGSGGTVFVFKSAGGVEIRGHAGAHEDRENKKRRAGLTRSRK